MLIILGLLLGIAGGVLLTRIYRSKLKGNRSLYWLLGVVLVWVLPRPFLASFDDFVYILALVPAAAISFSLGLWLTRNKL